MSIQNRRTPHGLAVDMSELADGFTFDGKHVRIQRWREKKEAEEFQRLVSQLVARKARARWRSANREQERAAQTARLRERRRSAFVPSLRVCAAPDCVAAWVEVFGRGHARKYCCRSCLYRSRRVNAGTHRCGICGSAGHNRRRCPDRETA